MNAKIKEHFIETYGMDETINLLFDVLNAIPSSVFIKNDKLEKIFANTANLELDERTAEETLGYTDFDIHSPENAAIFSAEDNAVLKEGKIRQNEESKIRKDGRKLHFLTLKNRISVGSDGYLLVGTNTIIDDIKARENDLAVAMAAVERSAADFEAVLDSMPLGISILDANLDTMFVNKANRALWDVPVDADVMGEPFRKSMNRFRPENMIDDDDAWKQRTERLLASIQEGNISPREARGLHGRTLMFSAMHLSGGKRLISYFDITEQKKAHGLIEQANLKSEQDFRDLKLLLDAMPLGVTMIDEQMNVVAVNAANRRNWNLDPNFNFEGTRYEDMVRSSHKDFPNLTKAEWELNVARCMAEVRHGSVAPREERGIGEDMFIFSCITLSNGNRLTSCFDITEQKKAQKALGAANLLAGQQSEDMRATMDAMKMGVALLDKNLDVLFVNKANYNMWNWSREDVKEGKPFREIIELNRYNGIYDVEDANWDDYVASRLGEIASGEIEPREFNRKDGKTYVYSCTALSGGKRLVCYFDISEQKAASEVILLASQKTASHALDLKATMDAMKMGVVLLDQNLDVLLVNSAFYDIWQMDKAKAYTGLPMRSLFSRDDIQYNSETDWDAYVDSRLNEILAGDIAPRELAHFQGATMIYSCTSLSEGKRLVCYFDISEQKAAENALKDAEQKAILADRAKSEFLANMSHEIRTPMNGVLGMAELLARTELNQKQKTFTDIIVKSGNALLTIINDILDFSKIDAGQLALDPAPFKLGEAIEDVATLVSARAQEKDLELIVRVDPALPEHVVGDVGRLRQIVTNLMGNAVKFTERGHVLVDVTGTMDEAAGIVSLMFKITDTGMGIPKDKIKQVFEKFSQVDTSSTRRHEGTGLGLAISTKLVALMGGEIGAESEHGEGSTFWFTVALPMHGTTVRKKILPFDVNGARILIIDDNPVNRSILLEQMRSWNFDACAATGGREGLAVVSQAKELGLGVDVVILDYHMPHMNGADVARAVRNNPAIADLPLILLTSVDTAMQGAEFNGIHINAHLMKPARSSLLFDTIVSVIREARTQSGETIIAEKPKTLLELGERMLAKTTTLAPAVGAHTAQAPTIPAYVAPVIEAPTVAAVPQLDILVAEDNAVNQIVFTQILESTPYSFEIVDNGRKALEAMKLKRPTIILMDVSMPEMNGLEATHEIRDFEAENNLPRTPIIGVTAHALKGDKDRCLEAGMDDYLSKPISPDMLAAKVEAHITTQRQIKRA